MIFFFVIYDTEEKKLLGDGVGPKAFHSATYAEGYKDGNADRLGVSRQRFLVFRKEFDMELDTMTTDNP